MTMTFAVPDAVPLAGLSVGSRVDFTFDRVGGNPTIRSLTRREASR